MNGKIIGKYQKRKKFVRFKIGIIKKLYCETFEMFIGSALLHFPVKINKNCSRHLFTVSG